MRLFYTAICCWFFNPLVAHAQDIRNFKYTKAASIGVFGKILPGGNMYHRLDTMAFPSIPSRVKHLLSHSAGLLLSFKTNSTTISAKWCVTNVAAAANLTPIAQKGLDLYIKKNNKWQFAGSGKPSAICSEGVLISHMDNTEKECLLYLPLYDEVHDVEVGVSPDATFSPLPEPFKKRILMYGSSILQGAAASRPGMAYPSRLSRASGLNFINMGVSGNAKMETEVADVIAGVQADAYILDCIPNATPKEINDRAAYLIKSIRKAHPAAPIIMIQSIIREHGYFDTVVGKNVSEQNKNIETIIAQLQKEKIPKLYFIKADGLLGDDHEGTVDGTHPNDLGFDRMLKILQPRIFQILKQEGIY